MVECNRAKVEVAGSNPVSRSIFLKTLDRIDRINRIKDLSASIATVVFVAMRYALCALRLDNPVHPVNPV